ncbi:tetratricopeptide repeat protein [Paraflavitalea sp. CAU 1676]|uniref:tetratricopeptide repeat protein n=1 Tax=Paraflavitalea sp. CAU 1676 TaxID=3032598 RepID=UPI0023D9D660|nr:tetratricopeptide repeat protein [Paraflavitalea sp. CAU 1676]MDF2189344.1 tetratricopeptide repeat protein [Paraflavitalea sp. CAU 1676]
MGLFDFLKPKATQSDNSKQEQGASFSIGDIFYTKKDGRFNLYKLLVDDEDFECYHILTYSPVDKLPTIAEIAHLPAFVYHSPFDKSVFAESVLLTNKQIEANDLVGYHEYLRQTQDPNYYVPIANNYYKAGLNLTDEKKYYEAIDSYSKAIDLFPHFFEAIDNRAFCKMDLGLWSDAIEDFKLSLQQNPNSLLAEFSIGECFLKMGDYKNAKRQFEMAHDIDPNHESPKQFLDKVNILLNK